MTKRGDDGVRSCRGLNTPGKRCEHAIGRLSPIRSSRIQASLRLSILIITFISLALHEHERIANGFRMMLASLEDMITVSPPLQQSLDFIEAANHGIHSPAIRYPRALIGIFVQGAREQRDVLASFETLDRAWREASPEWPLTIRFVFLPVDDPCLQGQVTSWPDRIEVVDQVNFEEMLPLLGGIRDLIRETEHDEKGCGVGKLYLSGYPAEPENTSAGAIYERRPVTNSAAEFDRRDEIATALTRLQ
jgi:hypothetical protein